MIKVKEYQEKLFEGVKKAFESGRFREFLAFSSRFRNYSFGNTLLIWVQCPGAKRVAGLKTWNTLGRRVKKGEKGIVIFAPVIKSTKKSPEETASDSREETQKTGAEVDTEEKLIGFKAVRVWDVSQTEGKPLPELEIGKPIMNGDAGALFKKILSASPVEVDYEDITGDSKGYYLPKEKRIVLSSDLTSEEQCKTLLHELAHHVVISELTNLLLADRGAHETVAEGAAYVASAHFGLDASQYSFVYIASWAQDVKKVFEAGKAIRETAARLIEMVDGKKAKGLEAA